MFALLAHGKYTVNVEPKDFNPRFRIEVIRYVRSSDEFHNFLFHLLRWFDPVLLPVAHRVLTDAKPDRNLDLAQS